MNEVPGGPPQRTGADVAATATDFLDAVGHPLAPGLISRASLARARGILESLPPIPAAGFERRLDMDRSAADLSVCASVFNGGRSLLSGSRALATWARRDPAWEAVRKLVAEWIDPGQRLSSPVSHLWLEFSTSKEAPVQRDGALPTPDVHLTFRDLATPRSPGESVALAQAAMAVMTLEGAGRALPDRVAEVLRRTAGCAQLAHIGFPMSREVSSVRLVLDTGRLDDLLSELARSGYGAQNRCGIERLRDLEELSDRVKVDLDVGEEVKARIGVEFHMESRVSAPDRWATFLEKATGTGLCVPNLSQDLVDWVGGIRLGELEAWPAPMTAALALLGARAEPVLFRVLSHVKVVVGGDRQPESKVYFGYFFRLVERAGR